MKYIFKSGIKEYIYGFIKSKQSLGYMYDTQEFLLYCFDRFYAEKYPCSSVLSKEIVMNWAERKENEMKKTQEGRICVVRQLAKYMNSIGIPAYILPQNIPGKSQRYQPHIYTDSELFLLFRETDRTAFDKRYPTRHLVSAVIFRLIYCCGLRHSEARLLSVENFNLEEGTIRIMDSKGKCRYVIPSEDVLRLCRRYHMLAESIYPGRKWFFQNHHGKPYSHDSILLLFHQCWQRTGIPNVNGKMPRIHDLRHAFCRKRLNLWMEEGRDLNACMPYLVMYLGHATFSETDYYLHLVSDMFPLIKEKSRFKTEEVIPEVEHENK